MEYFLPLNFPDPRNEIKDSDIEKVNALPGSHPFFNANHFQIPDIVYRLFESLNLTIAPTKTFMFKLEPNSSGPIHLDGNPAIGKLRPFGFNWAWGAENTTMEWFEIVGQPMHRNYNGIDIPYFDHTNTRLAKQAVLKSPNLVNLLYPHRVVNHTPEYRLSLSVGIEEKFTWNELTEYLRLREVV